MREQCGARSWSVVTAGTLMCALLAGCGDTSSTEDPGTTTATRGGLTPLGTALAVGETATVPVEGGGGVIELTVTSIEKGDPSDLEGVPGTPYYVRLEATVVSGDAYDFFAEQFISARADGDRLTTIASPATVGPCSWDRFELAPSVGTVIEPCITTVVEREGAPVDQVVYAIDGDGFTEDDPYVEWGGAVE